MGETPMPQQFFLVCLQFLNHLDAGPISFLASAA
jgi:hypothetical protein